MLLLASVFAAVTLASGSVPPGPPPYAEGEPQQTFTDLVDEFLAFHFYFNPVEASRLGVHAYDGRLPDMSQDGIFARIAAYHQWLERVREVERNRLTGDGFWDHRILEFGIRSRLLELEAVRSWERSPLHYAELVADALVPLATFASTDPEGRLRSVVARQRQIPELLNRARVNLLDPPRVETELAVEAVRGLIRWLQDDLPESFRDVGSQATREELRRSNRQAVEELRSFAAWLENDLLPESNREVHLGEELLGRMLLLEEHVELAVDELLEVSAGELERQRRRFETAARELDPGRSPEEVLRSLAPALPPDSVLPSARRRTEEARSFVVRRDLLTLPTDERPAVVRMPGFRTQPVSHLRAPGPFEDWALTAYWEVELPARGWTADQTAQHLSLLRRPDLAILAGNETFPGRFVQQTYVREVPSPVRKVFQPETLVGGWADYAEAMVLDEGLDGDDPTLRLVHLQHALLRLTRLRAGLLVHARGASLEEAEELFREEAYLEPFPARREARRLVHEPLAGSGALGKLLILSLRADYREHLREQDETYVLANFHDRFLRLGVPVPMARRILIPGSVAGGPL